MKIIDMHAHWGTRRGYALQDPAELALQERNWKHPPRYVDEAAMADWLASMNSGRIGRSTSRRSTS